MKGMEKPREKFLIVDGHNLLFQMFFGMPSRIVNHQGRPIHGTLGFVGALLKIIRMICPDRLVVIFDGEHENFRTAVEEAYKAGRADYSEAKEEENPFSQLSDIYTALDRLRIRHAEAAGDWEADDTIAAYALAYGGKAETVIASFDSDFFQLINGSVSVLRYRGKKTVLCDESYLLEKFGVRPSQYADFKAMTGDSADNLKGAEGIGPKTAAALLDRFGTLEAIIASGEEIQKPAVRASITRNAQRLRRSRRLIALDGRAELPFPWEELSWSDGGETTTQVLREIGLME